MRPVLFSFGSVQILAAPVFAGLAAIVAALYMHRHRAHARLTPERYWDLMLFLAAGTLAGGVLLYFLFFGKGFERNAGVLLRTGRVTGGTFFGNLLGAALGAWAACRWRGLSTRRVLDLMGPAAALGLAVMRLGCFQHGCCFGRRTDLPWAAVFWDPQSSVKRALIGQPIHPTQLYEAAAALAVFAAAHAALRRAGEGRLPAGSAFLAFLFLYAATRWPLDVLRASDPGLLRPLGMTTAQAFSLAAMAAAGLLWARWKNEPA